MHLLPRVPAAVSRPLSLPQAPCSRPASHSSQRQGQLWFCHILCLCVLMISHPCWILDQSPSESALPTWQPQRSLLFFHALRSSACEPCSSCFSSRLLSLSPACFPHPSSSHISLVSLSFPLPPSSFLSLSPSSLFLSPPPRPPHGPHCPSLCSYSTLNFP